MKQISIISFCIVLSFAVFAQTPKQVNVQYQSWWSINATARFSKKWGMMLDLHERRNDFMKNASFHFVRVGATYWLKDNLSISAGYGHLWLAPTKAGWKTFSNENRLFQQVQLITPINKIQFLQRLRNEQRWAEIMVNDKPSGQIRFTNRVRYLASLTISIFKSKQMPALVIADELLVHFGKAVVFNTFEQNRIFFGVRQKLTKALSFDMGYMLVSQQKFTGYQYDRNHTFRLFFYYAPDFRHSTVAH
jgi:hypothetical protein